MLKIITIVGARPQFVKLAPFSRAIRAEGWAEIIVHTGQHYDPNMSGSFFDELGIPKPDYNLEIGSGGHGLQTGRMLEAIEAVFEKERPDAVVVFGDTNSTLAGALAAAKMGIPCAHVEAGLRSFNRSMPEEINRVVADHTCDVLFAPTEAAVKHLKREGLEERCVLTGDIMVDAVLENRQRAVERSGVLDELGLVPGAYSVLTLHRPYTVDDPSILGPLLGELDSLGEPIVFPVHPRTAKTLGLIKEEGVSVLRCFGSSEDGVSGGKKPGTGNKEAMASVAQRATGESTTNRQLTTNNLLFIEPQGYLDFLCLQSNAKRILTDSGGIQKEAYILGKPCVTLRPETEWVETVEAGWNLLLAPDSEELAPLIRGFRPPDAHPVVFGEEVAAKMVKVLRRVPWL